MKNGKLLVKRSKLCSIRPLIFLLLLTPFQPLVVWADADADIYVVRQQAKKGEPVNIGTAQKIELFEGKDSSRVVITFHEGSRETIRRITSDAVGTNLSFFIGGKLFADVKIMEQIDDEAIAIFLSHESEELIRHEFGDLLIIHKNEGKMKKVEMASSAEKEYRASFSSYNDDDMKAALKYARSATEMDGMKPKYAIWLSFLLQRNFDYDEGLKVLLDAESRIDEKILVGTPGLYLGIGDLFLREKKYSNAKGYYLKVLNRHNNNFLAYVGLAKCHEGLGDITGAVIAYRHAADVGDQESRTSTCNELRRLGDKYKSCE